MSRSLRRFILPSILLVVLLGLFACANVPPPVDRVDAARQAIALAERNGAHENAPLDLYVARERIDAARQALSEEDYVAARRLADEAAAYADLARTKSQAVQNEQAVAELQVEVDRIERDLERGAAE